ncbi:FUSC family protein [Microbispora sp. GKU 823]|uniref:FUSC family protein n=1 Tax=Microbispora sp. GKU 823 TaxID=1652100 RepID=UPI0009A45662|nr:FUSC family protein [Microbispora sp. GKU 823]OPG10601.1 hypothetical protein B1L11_23385 [Microbispora sp. GKU 823]
MDFGDRVDRLRDRAAGGEREMVVLVLLRQIAHSAGRIREALDGSAEAARRLCAPGLGPALDMATLAVPPPLAFDDPRVRHALRVVLGTAFASIVIVLFKPAFPHWLVIAVLVTIQPTYGETRAKVWARVGGSTAGGLVSAAILHITPGHWLLVALIGVSAALAFGLAPTHQAYWATFMTMCVLLLLDFQVPQTARIAESRVVLTVVGGVIAIACARLLWPRGETERLAERVGRMLDSHAAVARTLAQLARGKAGAERAEERIRKAAVDAEMVVGALGYIAKEPGGTAPDAVEVALEAAQRVRDDLLTLISVLRDEPTGAGPVPDVLEAVAGHLRAAAQAVRGREPYEPAAEASRGSRTTPCGSAPRPSDGSPSWRRTRPSRARGGRCCAPPPSTRRCARWTPTPYGCARRRPAPSRAGPEVQVVADGMPSSASAASTSSREMPSR